MEIPYLSYIDLIIPPIFLLVFYFVAVVIRNRNIELNSSYRYYIGGLMVKLFGAIAICLFYVYYYDGGDTTDYHHDGVTISRAFLRSPYQIIRLTLHGIDAQNITAFDEATGFPYFRFDYNAFFVGRLTWILNMLSFHSFIGETLLLAFICYQAIWRLYQMLIYEFPNLQRQMAFAVLFIPSVFFWGSGLLKDSITFAAVALFTSSIHQIIKMRKSILKNILFILFASFLMIKIKPYIFFALLPGTVLWVAGISISNVKNKLVKLLIAPILIFIAVIAGYVMLGVISSSLGEYKLENVLNKAVVTQMDLKNEHYHGASFDIGDFDPTISGILGKALPAINVALFRPYLWEAYNPGMWMSGIENFVLLALTIYFLWKLRIYNLFRLMFRHHFLFFSVSFSLFFAFSVGLTTANFGALVRYKIPAIPFFVASLFIIANTYEELKKAKDLEIQGEEKVPAG